MTGSEGSFIVSLDTELAWGSFDSSGVEAHVEEYRNTREVVGGICELFEEYGVSATWALVTHLLDNCSGRENPHADRARPEFGWIDDWYSRAPCSTGVDKELWYAPDVLETIRGCGVDQEIGLHGYSHMILGDPGCNREAAEDEVGMAVEVANMHGVDPVTYVFPRNQVGHLDVLRDHGIRFYRGVDARWYETHVPGTARKLLRFVDEATMSAPPVVAPRRRGGLVEVPGSQVLRPLHGAWRYAPRKSRVRRAKKGLDRAAETGGTYHLWFHPFNLGIGVDRHLEVLEEILGYAAELRDNGRIDIHPIREVEM